MNTKLELLDFLPLEDDEFLAYVQLLKGDVYGLDNKHLQIEGTNNLWQVTGVGIYPSVAMLEQKQRSVILRRLSKNSSLAKGNILVNVDLSIND